MGTKNEIGEREYNPGWENMIAETCMGFIGEKPTSLKIQVMDLSSHPLNITKNEFLGME